MEKGALTGVMIVLGCASSPAPPAQRVEPDEPPTVLTGDGTLVCNISARENGRQTLAITNGGGLEFDAVVSPIVDGVVATEGPDVGGRYSFTSHLAKPAKGKLPGVGEVDLEELETKVAVEMKKYQQPQGRGTELSFGSADMAGRGIYVEFSGKARTPRGERIAFRVNLGAPTDGSGRVVPADANLRSEIMSKAVVIHAPANTVLVTTRFSRSP